MRTVLFTLLGTVLLIASMVGFIWLVVSGVGAQVIMYGTAGIVALAVLVSVVSVGHDIGKSIDNWWRNL